MKPRAVVFDAYGTLFDVHTVVTHGTDIDGDLRALSVLWRQRQLEYTWLRLAWSDTKTFGVSRKLRYDRPLGSFGSPWMTRV